MATTVPTEAYAYCQRITKEQAKNFYYAFITLPPARRRAIHAAYAFARLCDDIVDGTAPVEEKLGALRGVEATLEEARNGRPDGPIFEALSHAIRQFGIPWDHFAELIRGVEMDLTVSRYETFDDLRSYCYRVASIIGLIYIEIAGYTDPTAREYAVDLGLAMQLTNILRDVREDADLGRIYLPQDELARFGYTEQQLLAGELNPAFTEFMRFQVGRARTYFLAGKRLVGLLPIGTRACPAILSGIYTRLLDRMEDREYDVFQGRLSLSRREKLFLTVRLWCQSYVPLQRIATAW